jgi:hypothetical protein
VVFIFFGKAHDAELSEQLFEGARWRGSRFVQEISLRRTWFIEGTYLLLQASAKAGQSWSTSQNYKTPELRFRAVLTAGATRQVELVRA